MRARDSLEFFSATSSVSNCLRVPLGQASNWNTKRTWFVSYAFIPMASFCGSNKQNENNNNNSNNNPSIHLLKNLESCRVSFLAWLSFLWLSSVVVFNTHAHTSTHTHTHVHTPTCVCFSCVCVHLRLPSHSFRLLIVPPLLILGHSQSALLSLSFSLSSSLSFLCFLFPIRN